MENELPATKENPSALDGYERAKPGEPIFTLQGGDPIAVECAAIYIDKRRAAASLLPPGKERDDELIRCMEAERTLWAMQDYLKTGESNSVEAQRSALDTRAEIDLFDFRVRAASRLSNAAAEAFEIRDQLDKRGFEHGLGGYFEDVVQQLEHMRNVIEPRRMMKTA